MLPASLNKSQHVAGNRGLSNINSTAEDTPAGVGWKATHRSETEKPKALNLGLEFGLLPVRTTLAKYQIYIKYMIFNPVLQYLAVKIWSFVLNVFSLKAIKLGYQAVEKCASLQPSVQ